MTFGMTWLSLLGFLAFFWPHISECFGGSGMNGTRVLFSPKNNIPVSLLNFDFIDGRLLKLNCSKVKFTPKDVLQNVYWPTAGLRRLSKKLITMSEAVFAESDIDSKYRMNMDTYGDDPIEMTHQCLTRTIAKTDKNAHDALCECTSKLKPNDFCNVIDNFYPDQVCLDEMAAQVNETVHCASVYANLYSSLPTYSKKCTGYITSNIIAEDFKLIPLNSENVFHPLTIKPDIIEEEHRTYYLALKALERLDYWTDAHLFCDKLINYKVLDDIEHVVSEYKPVMYFHHMTDFLQKYPIAVLAERDETNYKASSLLQLNLVLVIREARTTLEASASITHRLGSPSTVSAEGLAHVGYNILGAQLYDEILPLLKKYAAEGEYHTAQFTVVGDGSLGMGAGAILQALLSKTYKSLKEDANPIVYNLIGFDGPSVGDAVFTTGLGQRVNVRNIVSKSHSKLTEHCSNFNGCDSTHFSETGETNEVFSSYVPLPGRVEFDLSANKGLNQIWHEPIHNFQFAANTRLCGTSCWLTSSYCTDEANSKCVPSKSQCAVALNNF